jgi:hypothetical protein
MAFEWGGRGWFQGLSVAGAFAGSQNPGLACKEGVHRPETPTRRIFLLRLGKVGGRRVRAPETRQVLNHPHRRGVPGLPCTVEASTNLSQWDPVITINADANGMLQHTMSVDWTTPTFYRFVYTPPSA